MKRSMCSLGCLALSAIIFGGRPVHAQIDVIVGEIKPVRGPDDIETLQFPENVVYAVNVWGETAERTVNDVTFLSDREDVNPDGIPGYRHDWTHNVTNWETKPEFGDTEDEDNLEEIMSDIRWTDNSAGGDTGVGSHFEVTPNTEYTLQLLISGNHEEDRIWDIYLEGELAVDEFQSNNYEAYDQGQVWAYTHTFIAPDNEYSVTFNQGTTGSDGNAILQGAILFSTGVVVTPGDFNQDGAIDVADFLLMLNNFNRPDQSFFDGDINFDRQVDLNDFVEFRRLFLEANPSEGQAVGVPEPSAVFSVACGAALLLGIFRRRRGRRW